MLFAAWMRHIAREQWPLLHAVISRTELSQTPFQLIELNIRHKAECPQIDATDRHGVLRVASADAEQCTVSAETQGKVGGQTLDVVCTALLHAELRRTRTRQDDTRAPCRKKAADAQDNIPHLRTLDIGKNCNRQHNPLRISSIQCTMCLCHHSGDLLIRDSRMSALHPQIEEILNIPLWSLDRRKGQSARNKAQPFCGDKNACNHILVHRRFSHNTVLSDAILSRLELRLDEGEYLSLR